LDCEDSTAKWHTKLVCIFICVCPGLIINYSGDKKFVYFLNGYGYKHEITWEQQRNSLATLTVTYPSWVALQPLAMENDVFKCKRLGQGEQDPFHGPFDRRTLLYAKSIYGVCERPDIPWEEFEYRVDVCPVTNGAHIEHLEKIFIVCILLCIITWYYYMAVNTTTSK
jgi:hypothetical protein